MTTGIQRSQRLFGLRLKPEPLRVFPSGEVSEGTLPRVRPPR